jgi:NlpC/P60 family
VERPEGPDSYDCSGLTWLAWQHASLAWQRTSAAAQWQWLHRRGHEVPAAQLRAGDLLLYANDPQDPASIHHVAMAIGDGRMVEAPAPGIPVRIVTVRQTELFAVARPIPDPPVDHKHRKASQMPRRHLPILTDAQRQGMNPSLLEPVEYRKSGLSLNHIVGCPLVLSVSSGQALTCGSLRTGQMAWARPDHCAPQMSCTDKPR